MIDDVNMTKIVYLGGIPAAGKTSVLNWARSRDVDSEVQYIEGTLFMKNVAAEKLGKKFSTLEVEGMNINDKIALVNRLARSSKSSCKSYSYRRQICGKRCTWL